MYVDLITFEIGDIVQAKSKGDSKPKEIIDVDYIGEGKYQVLYFKDEERTAHVANNYHPYDKDKRAAYYEFLSKVRNFKNKTKGKKAPIKEDIEDEIKYVKSKKEIQFNFKLNFDKM